VWGCGAQLYPPCTPTPWRRTQRQPTTAPLRRNDFLVTAQTGTGTRVGLGSRTCEIAGKWRIELPDDPRENTDEHQ
jgi:hypothetical protein